MYCSQDRESASQGFESATDEFWFETEYMYRSRIWKGREVLKVVFLNPEVLSQWGLTIGTVLDWANLWNADHRNKVPVFAQASNLRRADIRVMCSGNYIPYSRKYFVGFYFRYGEPNNI